VDLAPLLTVAELREVIALHEHLLPLTRRDTDRLDLHQVLADLYRRLVTVQSRHLAAAADVDDAWRSTDGRDVLLSHQLLVDVVRNLERLGAATPDTTLLERARATRALLAAASAGE
jgi:hypothetical protein